MLSSRGRAQLSLAAALLWLWGFELGPSLHLALHAVIGAHWHSDDGSHAAFGGDSIHDDGDADHAHDEGHGHGHWHGHGHGHEHWHAEAERRSDASAEPTNPEVRALALGHGQHSLLHRGIAVLQPPPATPPVPEALLQRLESARPLFTGPRPRTPETLRARGPPTGTPCAADRARTTA